MPDLILYNANVLTMDLPVKGAALVAIENGRIRAVLPNGALARIKENHTGLVDCRGMTLVPGFCDAHFHLFASVSGLLSLDLSPGAGIRSIPDIQRKIRDYAEGLAPGTWIRCSGYNEFHLAEKRHPNRRDLDAAAPDHPVKLTHRSHHAHVLNSQGLEQTGIDRFTPEPPGGLMDRFTDTGEPSGLLFEMGEFLLKRIPKASEAAFRRGVNLLNRKLLSQGITSIHDTSSINSLDQWATLVSLKKKKIFHPRVSMALGMAAFERQYHHMRPFAGNHVLFKGVKIILDRTTGRFYPCQEELNRQVLKIHRAGLQAAIHAVEEEAVESACTAIEYALGKYPKKDHRHRIEHCSICPPSLAERVAAAGIHVVTQPSFIHAHGERYLQTVGQRDLDWLYPLNTLIKSNVRVAGSSDAPIVDPAPVTGIFSAVSRLAPTGRTVSKHQGINTRNALEMYTKNAATACFDEDIKGTITPGKVADLVLLDQDPLRLPPKALRDVRVMMTLVNGNIAWESPGVRQ